MTRLSLPHRNLPRTQASLFDILDIPGRSESLHIFPSISYVSSTWLTSATVYNPAQRDSNSRLCHIACPVLCSINLVSSLQIINYRSGCPSINIFYSLVFRALQRIAKCVDTKGISKSHWLNLVPYSTTLYLRWPSSQNFATNSGSVQIIPNQDYYTAASDFILFCSYQISPQKVVFNLRATPHGLCVRHDWACTTCPSAATHVAKTPVAEDKSLSLIM
jgi:hypothetical protein